ncbi:MAG: M15 family metallopeptidase [Cellulomonas sp.]|nr:M15 family metallopeptidase [Cellulomonas sp.]
MLTIAMVAAPAWVAVSAEAKARTAEDLPTTLEALAAPVDLSPPQALAAMADRGRGQTSRDAFRDSSSGNPTAASPDPATAAAEQRVATTCSGVVKGPQINGRLTVEDLCDLWQPPYKDRADAVVSAFTLNDAFEQRFGRAMCLTSGYRNLEEQAALRITRGGLAAPPGTSNHGWGLAIDFCPSTYTGTAGAWLKKNGPTYGWDNPSWARPGGVGPYEPWHWEYETGVNALVAAGLEK